MKILYAVQGTGNGHITRAAEIVPALKRRGQVDVLVSGTQADIDVPLTPKFKYKGISFVFGKNGGVDIWKTIKTNSSLTFLSEIKSVPVEEYDLVINDFEPISAWAARRKNIPIISLSHQAALLHPGAPRPAHKDRLGLWFLKNYAPVKHRIGFHFKAFDVNIYTPVIRRRVREIETSKNAHITVYLPAYGDKKIIKILRRFSNTEWHLFSKHTQVDYIHKNIKVFVLDEHKFISSMSQSNGVLCGAGFETPAEALYLRKKLMVVPMKNQYEQHYNAVALEQMGVPVLPILKKKNIYMIRRWLKSPDRVKVLYENNAQKAIDKLLLIYIEYYRVNLSSDDSLSRKGIGAIDPMGAQPSMA